MHIAQASLAVTGMNTLYWFIVSTEAIYLSGIIVTTIIQVYLILVLYCGTWLDFVPLSRIINDTL